MGIDGVTFNHALSGFLQCVVGNDTALTGQSELLQHFKFGGGQVQRFILPVSFELFVGQAQTVNNRLFGLVRRRRRAGNA